MIRKTIIVVLTLAAVGIGSLLVVPPACPCIVFAWGYGDTHVLEPLTEHNGGILSFLTNKKRARVNWDGKWLFVDGACGVCGKPHAPRGSFVLANLPQGLAYCHHDGSGEYTHMTVPTYVRRSTLAILSAFPSAPPSNVCDSSAIKASTFSSNTPSIETAISGSKGYGFLNPSLE